jgi:hypothetical protein
MNMLSPPREIQAGQSTLLSSLLTILARGLIVVWLRVAPWAGPVFLLAVFSAVAVFSWLKPTHNWDVVAYIAAAMKSQFASFDDVHRQVFSKLKVGLPVADYQMIIAGNEYRSRQFADPAALESMLGMYDVKWLYVKLLTLLGPLLGWLNAGVVINMGSLALLFFSVWAWLSRFKMLALSPLVAGLFLALGMADTYSVSTPDFLAIALMTSGVLMLDRGRSIAALAPVTLAVLARPDGAAAVCLIGFMLIAMRDPRWREGAIMLCLAVGAYAFAKASSTSPGWWPHLWFSTYQMQNTMVGFDPAFSFSVYAQAFAYNFGRAITENNWLGFYLTAIFASIWIVSESRADERIRHPRMVIVSALIFAVAAKFLLFPLHDTRTYLPILFPMILLIGAQMRLLYANRGALSMNG